MESEAISIDEYLDSDVSQRFEFLYENYSVLKAIIKDYREDIINDVIDMKSYNRRAANGELGVRVKKCIDTRNPGKKQTYIQKQHHFETAQRDQPFTETCTIGKEFLILSELAMVFFMSLDISGNYSKL